MEKRNHYTAEFKAKVVLELLGDESTLNQVAAKYQLNPQMSASGSVNSLRMLP